MTLRESVENLRKSVEELRNAIDKELKISERIQKLFQEEKRND